MVGREARLAGALGHLGVTVCDLEASARFWAALTGGEATPVEHLEGPGVGRVVGYPGARIGRCWVRTGAGLRIELVRYLDPEGAPPLPEGTAHPGNVHICLPVPDMAAAYDHALACGARRVGDGWVEVQRGPAAGAKVAYLRSPEGVTLELWQAP